MLVVTIYVSSPSSVLSSYDKIKVYRSDFSNGYFSEVTDASTRISLDSNIKYYTFEDTSVGATSSSWYSTSYYNSITTAESAQATAVRGIEVEDEYYDITYPVEKTFTSMDFEDIDKIRFYIGDQKSVKHEYVSPSCALGYESVSADGYTYEMENKGWPLSVTKDGSSYTSLTDPYVIDYNHLKFSNTISTVSGVLDIWSESFRWSDREILKAFNTATAPPKVSSSNFTEEMQRLQAAITILNSEIADLMASSSGAITLYGELSFNPKGVLEERRKQVSELRKKLDALVEDSRNSNITGVLID